MSKLKSTLAAVIYVRVSTEKQVDNYSLETQEKILRGCAAADGYQNVVVFREEGKSGRNTNRPAYQEMMKYIGNNHIDAVYVHKLDRLHREECNVFNDLRFFREQNIRLVAPGDGIDTMNGDTSLLIALQAALGANFSRNLSTETRKGLLARAQLGLHLGGSPPYGYTVDTDTGELLIDEITAPAVLKAFELYADGYRTGEICDWLTENGYVTPKGNVFKPNTLNTMFHNEKYRGVYTWDKATPKDAEGHRNSHAVKETYIRIEDGCPRIVSDELFAAVQERLALNRDKAARAKPKRYYPLNGRIWCAECGSRMTGNVQYSSGKQYFQYRCSKHCGNKAIRAELLETSVLESLQMALFSSPNRAAILKTLDDRAKADQSACDSKYQQLRTKRCGLKTSQDNLMKILETGRATKAIMNRLDRISGELEQTDFQIQSLDRTGHSFTEADLEKLQKGFVEYMQQNGSIHNKQLLNSTIEKVVVGKDQVHVSLADGISVDSKTKKHFNRKEAINMNTVTKKTVNAILLSACETEDNKYKLEFRLREGNSCCYDRSFTLNAEPDAFFRLADQSEIDPLAMFGEKFNITFEIGNGAIRGIVNIEAA